MMLLPRGTPVKEGIDPGKVNLPDAFRKLQKSQFTGYLRFQTTQGTGMVIFTRGRLISSLFGSVRERLIAYDAIKMIFQRSLAGHATLDIYRLSPALAMNLHAMLHGHAISMAQEVRLLDIRGLLDKLKAEQFSGCLRTYTRDQIALIFYREGKPLGFFHDGADDIETTAGTTPSVAQLAGAKIDVLRTEIVDEKTLADLLVSADLTQLWTRARQAVRLELRAKEEEFSQDLDQREKLRRQQVVGLLKDIAGRNLGRIGAQMAEKEFAVALADQGLISEAVLDDFYLRIGKAAKLLAGPSKIRLMIDEMQRSIKSLLKTT